MGAAFFLGTADKIDSAWAMKGILSQAHHIVCPKPQLLVVSCHPSRHQVRFLWLEVNVWSHPHSVLQGEYIILVPTDANKDIPGYCKSQTASLLGIILHHLQLKGTMFSTPSLFCCWTFKQLIYPAMLVALRNYASSSSPLISWTKKCDTFKTFLVPLFSPSAFVNLVKQDRHPQTNDRHLKILP